MVTLAHMETPSVQEDAFFFDKTGFTADSFLPVQSDCRNRSGQI